MINFTAAAIEYSKKAMKGAALRLSVHGGGCSGLNYKMSMDWELPKLMDKTFDFNGLKVYVDGISLPYLDGVTVDYVETLENSGFKFNNPNAVRTCGCGSSFSA
jgi:iron-sulfur cluster assembly protein